ncbi:LpqB family beta-propeller domain-containing protein [Luteimicrobium xylanilyticum]|uniref:Lipoprotein LpqB n=1 Tax=Luteimicrobium xylanilyticum TaxID=1133546 RepID=A0A5P9QC60_9MICO|nr:LpqB family beta-propeller domain-containing protein [Luteimicrobium xylanilyticum]QFU99033.1 Lipoprotein LpqB [Luteimicrobium xylanilyticum]
MTHRPAPSPRRDRRRSRAALVVLVAAVVGVLAACSSLPVTGGVHAGTTAVPGPGPVYLGTPDSPQEGASPLDIVRGFIDAQAAGVGDDFTVAKEYLAPDVTGWDPWDSVTVFSGEPTLAQRQTAPAGGGNKAPASTPTPGTRTVVHGELASLATVASDGEFQQEAPDRTKDLTFTLEADSDGQWRITELDDGISMSAANFEYVYRSVSVYFPSMDHQMLVPDVRWFPQRTAQTQAVQAVLQGPVAWLRDSVDSVVPEGTTLSVDAVAVDEDGVATVDLTAPALSASGTDRAVLLQQLTTVLTQFPQVRSVRLEVAGSPLKVTGPASLSRDPSPGDDPYVVTDHKVRRLDAASGKQEALAGTVATPSDVTALAVGTNGSPAVVRVGSKSLVQVSGDARRTLLTGDDVAGPSVDRFRWVWSARGDDAGYLELFDKDGAHTRLAVTWLQGRRVLSLQVSRDGARVALVTSGATGVQVDLAGVARSGAGVPVRLSDPVAVGATITDARQVVWVDEDDLAVLGRTGSGTSPTVNIVPVADYARSLSSVSDVASIASGRGESALYAVTTSHELFGRRATGATWLSVAKGIEAAAFPG